MSRVSCYARRRLRGHSHLPLLRSRTNRRQPPRSRLASVDHSTSCELIAPSVARPASGAEEAPHGFTLPELELRGEAEGGLHKRVSASDQETRDRAERGSAVRGSARASVLALQTPLPTPRRRDLPPTSAQSQLMDRLLEKLELQRSLGEQDGRQRVAIANLTSANAICELGGCQRDYFSERFAALGVIFRWSWRQLGPEYRQRARQQRGVTAYFADFLDPLDAEAQLFVYFLDRGIFGRAAGFALASWGFQLPPARGVAEHLAQMDPAVAPGECHHAGGTVGHRAANDPHLCASVAAWEFYGVPHDEVKRVLEEDSGFPLYLARCRPGDDLDLARFCISGV